MNGRMLTLDVSPLLDVDAFVTKLPGSLATSYGSALPTLATSREPELPAAPELIRQIRDVQVAQRGPCANVLKESRRTKTPHGTRRTLSIRGSALTCKRQEGIG